MRQRGKQQHLVTALLFGPIHRDIGIFRQLNFILAVVGVNSHPRAGRNVYPLARRNLKTLI